jgi:hypothetical protein
MDEIKIILSALWVATMLTYLLGDVLRIFAGDFVAGEIDSKPMRKSMWLVPAILMLIPILMVVLSLTLPFAANRWANIGVAAFFFLFNLVGLPTYPGAYDKFLLAVSMLFNLITIRLAWTWAAAAG